MSWFFYFCIVAVAFLVLMWWLIVKAKVYGNNDRVDNFTIVTISTLFFVGMVGFFNGLAIQMDVNTRGGKGVQVSSVHKQHQRQACRVHCCN